MITPSALIGVDKDRQHVTCQTFPNLHSKYILASRQYCGGSLGKI